MEVIRSRDNKRFSKYKSLDQKKYRNRLGLFKVDGYKLVQEALASGYEIEEVVIMEDSPYMDDFPGAMVISQELYGQLVDMKNPEGVSAIVRAREAAREDLGQGLFCLDRIADPGNLGTIIRSCDSFAFRDLVIMPGCVDAYNAKVLRASMGSIFRVRIHYMTEGDILDLTSRGYQIISSSLEEAIPIQDLVLPDKYIVVIGSESHGISDFFKKESHAFVKIPIEAGVDSLNAAIAASIFMYDFASR